MLRTDKERVVSQLAAELKAAETLIVADYRGLTNKQLEALRDELLAHGARFRIVKNTLTRLAAAEAGAESLLVMLEGPTAIAFIESGGDPAAVAKALAATAKQTNVLTLRGGVLEGKTLSGDEVDRLATLPPVDVLRAQLVGAIVAPITQLVALVAAPLRDLHGLVDARIKQLEEQGEVVTPAPEEAPAEAAAEEPAAEAEPTAAAEAETDAPEAAVEAPQTEPEIETEPEPEAEAPEASAEPEAAEDVEESTPDDAAEAEPETEESEEQ